MLSMLASLAIRRPRQMLLLALAVFLISAAFGATAIGLLNARNPFSDPSSASARAEQAIENATGLEASPGVLALVSAPPGTPAVSSVARAIAAVPGVAAVTAPAAGHGAGLVSIDGRASLVVATLRAAPSPNTVLPDIEAALRGRHDVQLGGADVAGVQTGKQAEADLGFAEAIALPLLTILAFFIFRGIAALLPLAVGGTAILATLLVLRLVNAALPLSIFAVNVVIGLGLGLAVDYSLFLVWRFREELQRQAGTDEALRATLATTGRTILFSASTVAAALASLTVFPQRFLVSMGLGGALVALIAAASALLIVPSLLVLLSRRIGRARPRADSGAWYRLATGVMRRPALAAAGTTVLLLVIAAPALGVRWSGIDATILPPSQSARVVSDTIARDFPPSNGSNTMLIVAPAPANVRPRLASYASQPGDAARNSPGQRPGPARTRHVGDHPRQPERPDIASRPASPDRGASAPPAGAGPGRRASRRLRRPGSVSRGHAPARHHNPRPGDPARAVADDRLGDTAGHDAADERPHRGRGNRHPCVHLPGRPGSPDRWPTPARAASRKQIS